MSKSARGELRDLVGLASCIHRVQDTKPGERSDRSSQMQWQPTGGSKQAEEDECVVVIGKWTELGSANRVSTSTN